MSKYLKLFSVLVLLTLQSCFMYGKKELVSLEAQIKKKTTLDSSLSSVVVSNNQITIHGSGFSKVTSVLLQGNGVNASLSVSSVSDSQIIATASSALSILVNGSFNLIIGTVEAQSTYPVIFTLQNGAVTAAHLSQMGATSGQVLKWNSNTSRWEPASLANSQVYLGTWNANTNTPDISTLGSFQNGDYFIVSTAGSFYGVNYAVGDWAMFNGAAWERINNTSNVVASFQGRKGIVTLQASDYVTLKDNTTHKLTGSSINDLADIDLTIAPTNGQTLKWNAASGKWIPSDDLTNGGAGSIATTDIANGAVTIAKMTLNNGDIPQIAINGLATSLAGKEPTLSAATASQYYRGDKTWQSLNSDAVSEGASNLYFANARVLGVPLSGFGATNSAIVATDSIITAFGKAQGQINSLTFSGSSYLLKNGVDSITGEVTIDATLGSLVIPFTPSSAQLTSAANVQYVNNYALPLSGGALSGDLQLNTKIKFRDSGANTASIQAPTTVSSSYVLKLPSALGSANQVLTTDASGNLSWTTPATSTAPSGSAGGDLGGTYPNPTVNSLPQSRITNLVTDLAGKISTTLTNGNIFVGNASNIATSVSVSGDATLSNSGAVTLKNTGTAGTYSVVTTDGQGRVTSGSNISGTTPVNVTGTVVSMPAATTSVDGYLKATDWTLFNNKQNALSKTSVQDFSKLRVYGSNATNYVELTAPTLSSVLSLTLPNGNGTSGQVLTTDGAGVLSWTTVAAGGGGTITSVTGAAPIVSSGGNMPSISITQATTTTNGYLSSADWNTFNGKQASITAGTTAQYFRGDKSFATLDTSVVPENTNLYFSNARALGVLLTGLNATNSAIVATDSIISAFGKAQGQINSINSAITSANSNLALKADMTNVTQTITATTITGLSAPVVGSDAANKTYVDTQVATKQGTLSKTSVQDLSKVRIYGSNATNYLELSAGTLTGNRSLIFPDSNGSSGNVLTTDGAGNLSWSAQAAAPVTSVAGRIGAITLTSTDVAEGTNLYYTNARAIAAPITSPTLTNSAIATSDTIQIALGKLQAQFNNVLSIVLTGLSTATSSAITAADSILVAFGKLQKQITDLSSSDANKLSKNTTDSITATITVSGAGDIIVPSTPAGMTSAVNKTYVDSNSVANAGGAASVQIGTLADRPAAAAGNTGRMYVANDSGNEAVYVSTGSAWIKIASNGLSGTLDDTTAAGGTVVKRASSGEVYGQYIVPVTTVTENTACTLPTGTIAKDAAGNILTCQ